MDFLYVRQGTLPGNISYLLKASSNFVISYNIIHLFRSTFLVDMEVVFLLTRRVGSVSLKTSMLNLDGMN